MTDINQTILERSSGNKVLNPDEQRYYLGTFKERVLVTVQIKDLNNENTLTLLDQAIQSELKQNDSLKMTIASEIPLEKQMAYMKNAKANHIPSSIIQNKITTSPFAIVLATDHAVNREETDLFKVFHLENQQTENAPKKNFLKRLFGK
ncbi:DUF1694 domain-containing protein [Streptococcus hyovaginalis]|uniref:DUF1694 domain-containing protein n=1 Tax=Streptococcus hyovaginalis TaxID=149015 RepID=UPI003AEBE3C6